MVEIDLRWVEIDLSQADPVVTIVEQVCSAIPMEDLHLIQLETLETEEPVQRQQDIVASFGESRIQEVHDTPPGPFDLRNEEDQHMFLPLRQELEEIQRYSGVLQELIQVQRLRARRNEYYQL